MAQHAACDQRTQIVAWVAQLIALMVRYRGSHAALRRQYRWVLWSMGFVVRGRRPRPRPLMLVLSSNSNLAVASSTVAVAGVFRTLHRRVRHSVDRRYNRTDGDAEAECFAAACGTRTDLEVVTAQLRTVIRDTLQPHTVHLWIRPLTRGHLPCHGKILVNGCRSARCCS